MKNFIKKSLFVLITLLVMTFTSCKNQPIVGPDYVVTEVSNGGMYGLKYRVKIYCVNRSSHRATWDGNHHVLYTDTPHMVGDTIHIK